MPCCAVKCRRKAVPPSQQQQPGKSSQQHSKQAVSGGSFSTWEDSDSDDDDFDGGAAAAAARGAGCGSSDDEGGWMECQTTRNAKKTQQPHTRGRTASAPQGVATAAAAGRRSAAHTSARGGNAAAAAAASQPQAALLLQPSFKPSAAWQFSSSNLLRLSHASGGKRRFKPVVKPEALLKAPVVTLKQLAHSVGAAGVGGGQHMQVGWRAAWGCVDMERMANFEPIRVFWLEPEILVFGP